MTARAQHHRAPRPPLTGVWRTFLLLGLLAGLFGMHALGPGTVVAGASHAAHSASHTSAMTDESVCHGTDSGGGHAQHSDPTCASGAVAGAPALPAPLPDPAGSGVAGDLDPRSPVTAPEGGRAPPSPAELQILRT
ncbi:DUF6153 family protein [Streptomyces sp. NPDC098781]|uniref:DUF6153 family protein n=1 Tax=Streptomyces sp. NPDC098781 TaxID=3366097 RepID=UPI00381FD46D